MVKSSSRPSSPEASPQLRAEDVSTCSLDLQQPTPTTRDSPNTPGDLDAELTPADETVSPDADDPSNDANGGGNAPTITVARQLFAGNLPFRVRWQDLKDLFRKAGNVLRADVAMGYDNRSKGHGTVLFATLEDAKNAIEMFHNYKWQGRVLEVREDRGFIEPNMVLGGVPSSVSGSGSNFHQQSLPMMQQLQLQRRPQSLPPPPRPNMGGGIGGPYMGIYYNGMNEPRAISPPANFNGRQLFVGNLPFNCQWQDLKDLFRNAGNILRADVAQGYDGRSRGFGTVLYATPEDARNAVAMYDGAEYQGRILRVHFDKFASVPPLQPQAFQPPQMQHIPPQHRQMPSSMGNLSHLMGQPFPSYTIGPMPPNMQYPLHMHQAMSPFSPPLASPPIYQFTNQIIPNMPMSRNDPPTPRSNQTGTNPSTPPQAPLTPTQTPPYPFPGTGLGPIGKPLSPQSSSTGSSAAIGQVGSSPSGLSIPLNPSTSMSIMGGTPILHPSAHLFSYRPQPLSMHNAAAYHTTQFSQPSHFQHQQHQQYQQYQQHQQHQHHQQHQQHQSHQQQHHPGAIGDMSGLAGTMNSMSLNGLGAAADNGMLGYDGSSGNGGVSPTGTISPPGVAAMGLWDRQPVGWGSMRKGL